MEYGWIVGAGVLGLLVGSFLNVVILRLPAGESVVSPGSRCPGCGTPLRWYHNIPLLSWLALRGRCAHCGQPIGWQYPLVEAATALLWAGNVAAFGPGPEAVRAIVFLTFLLAIAGTDARFYLIPDELSLGGAVAGIAMAGAFELRGTPPAGIGLQEAVLGALVGSATLWLVAVVGGWALKREAMGGGDIKMMALIGAFLGWKGALLTVFLGALAGTLVFVPISLKSDRLVPFGLFLALGAGLALYLGDPLLDWYMGFYR
ncbi:MAG TPA: prepilin peptidase [Gemmatimonadota bacterium]|nr:prepilin peptidase [Gemmatimonadota bacterium]